MYERLGINQQSAGVQLIESYSWKGSESVLDIGCGDGRLTALISELTNGDIIGVDQSVEMTNVATKNCPKGQFVCLNAEQINLNDFGRYKVIFSNSVIHWFQSPESTIKKIGALLDDDGVWLLQTPTKAWCPSLQQVINDTYKQLSSDFVSCYSNPWFHLDGEKAYRALFGELGFTTAYASTSTVESKITNIEQLWSIFLSGPAQAFLNQSCYSLILPTDFEQQFKESFFEVAESANLDSVEFNRLFFKLKP